MSDRIDAASKPGGTLIVLLVVSWLWVGIPLAWGVSKTIDNSRALFQVRTENSLAQPAPK